MDVIPTSELVVDGLDSGYYGTTQIATSTTENLYIVNGDNDARYYDGTTWNVVASFTNVQTEDLNFVWVFANRLFFIENDSRSVWYLPVDSITGVAEEFTLDSVFEKGGRLITGGSWSQDSGAGLDDKCVFISDQGEVAIYTGTDPSQASEWALSGVYQITKPLGKNAIMTAGGDFVIATEEGLVPISEATLKDPAALSVAAISRQIEPAWKDEVAVRRTLPWDILKWSTNNMVIIALPVPSAGVPPQCFAVNLETGAWSRFTGWDTNCVGLFNDVGLFGTSDGLVNRMENSGTDSGAPYTSTYVGLFDHFATSPGIYKQFLTGRAILRSTLPINPLLSVTTDYIVTIPSPPNSADDIGAASLWDDNDDWDDGELWDAGTQSENYIRWASMGKSGFAAAPVLQITMASSQAPQTELVILDYTFSTGSLMV